MGRVALAAAVLALALAPASAAAGVRYASPTGMGDECSQPNPCLLETAVGTGAAENDEIVVGPGTYSLAATLEPTVPMTIHGAPGQVRPTIVSPPGTTVLQSSVTVSISDLTFQSRDADTLFLAASASTAERIEAVATSDSGFTALRTGNGFVLRDSLLRAYGPGAVALFYRATETSVVTLSNVTAIASGANSSAISIFATATGPEASISATNVIADAAVGLFADADPGTFAAIHLTNSNYTSGDPNQGMINGVGTQILPPRFANAPAGDFHQAPGSPTVDAGLTDAANGALDLDGNARTAGAATDIGAYESPPPPPGPAPAGAPVDTSATGTIIGALRLSRRGVVRATLACPKGESRCAWSYQLRSRTSVRTRGKRRVIRFGSGKASAAGAKRVTVRIRLSKRNFRLIKRKRRLAVKLTVRMTDAAANIATTRRTATLRAPR